MAVAPAVKHRLEYLAVKTLVAAVRAMPGPLVRFSGSLTGFASYVVDPEDPYPDGFTVGDIW